MANDKHQPPSADRARLGRHVRIFEWDEVDVTEPDEIAVTPEEPASAAPSDPSKPSSGLSSLLKRKIF